MNKNIYKNTRYQNIKQHIKNKNYVIIVNKPVKSSISRINGEKIWKIEEAIKIRDNPKTGLQKKAEIIYKDNLDNLWIKYIDWCKYVDKQSYNTYHKKEIIYNSYIKGFFKKSLSKYTREDFAMFIDQLDTTDNMKNHILKHIKTCLNWCVDQEIIISNPAARIKSYKISKKEMKFWEPNDIKKFFEYINMVDTEESNRIRLFVLISLVLGDRTGETRVLSFNSINEYHNTIIIEHSINYDTKSKNFISNTKTKTSQRTITVSSKVVQAINNYKQYLIDLGYDVKDNSLIFLNYSTNRPFSDSYLRNKFYYYCDQAEVPKIRPYDLRHTFSTIMLSEGIPMAAISKILGHASIRTTVDKYAHIAEKSKKEVVNITNNLLF